MEMQNLTEDLVWDDLFWFNDGWWFGDNIWFRSDVWFWGNVRFSGFWRLLVDTCLCVMVCFFFLFLPRLFFVLYVFMVITFFFGIVRFLTPRIAFSYRDFAKIAKAFASSFGVRTVIASLLNVVILLSKLLYFNAKIAPHALAISLTKKGGKRQHFAPWNK